MPRFILAIVILAAIIVPVVIGAYAQSGGASIEVRVWERIDDPSRNFVSARPAGGSWRTLGTVPVTLDSTSGAYRYGDIDLRMPSGLVNIRVWERTANPARNFVSARVEGGSWRTLGTIPIDLDSTSASGRYRYSDITLAVHAPEPAAPPQPAREAAPESGVCDWTDARARVRASTVKVVTPTASGTAFYVGGNQWITAAHVVNDRPARITLSNSRIRASATLLALNANSDLAILIADASGANPIGWAGTLPQDTQIAVVGYPLGQSTSSITRGFVTRHDTRGGVSYIQTDASVNPGNSGGPLVDACGRVGGVVSSRAEETRDGRPIDGIAFAVAEPTLRSTLTALGIHGYAITPPGQYPDEFDAPANQQLAPADECPHPDRHTTYLRTEKHCIDGVIHHIFDGQVYANGERASDGGLLEAVVNGTVCGSTTSARFTLSVPEGCGGAAYGTPITLRYDGSPVETYSAFGGVNAASPRWTPPVRYCDPRNANQPERWRCRDSGGSLTFRVTVSTLPTTEMVRFYVYCVLDHWGEISAWNMVRGLTEGLDEHPASYYWPCLRDDSDTLAQQRLDRRTRLMTLPVLERWNSAAAAYWTAIARYRDARSDSSASARHYQRQVNTAWSAYTPTVCPLAALLGWDCDEEGRFVSP